MGLRNNFHHLFSVVLTFLASWLFRRSSQKPQQQQQQVDLESLERGSSIILTSAEKKKILEEEAAKVPMTCTVMGKDGKYEEKSIMVPRHTLLIQHQNSFATESLFKRIKL